MKEGTVLKSLSTPVTDEELELINKYTRRPFSAEEVYAFSLVLCDNDVDRDYERFTVEALFEMEKLFVGKTGIFDHNPTASNQTARIFTCRVEAVEGRKTCTGDEYFRLTARAYMPLCEETKGIITQIESGIKKEISVGLSAQRKVCSVCSVDRGESRCEHRKGEYYGGKLCYHELSGVSDAYEWSFVAVPAQRDAGVIKGFSNRGGKEFLHVKDIIKSLAGDKEVTLSRSSAKALGEYIEELEIKAKSGEEYRGELVEEVIRTALTTQSGLSRKTMEKAIGNLGIGELREFLAAFKSKGNKKAAATPQLLPVAKTNSPSKGNKEFRI